MELSEVEKIRVIMDRQCVTSAELARRTGQSAQNLSNKFKRKSFSVKELRGISAALGCELRISFVLPDGSII